MMRSVDEMFDVKNVSGDVRDIMEHLKEHYMRCYRVGCMMFDAKCGEPRSLSLECCETMRQANITTGIEWCCIAREAGLDMIVDMLWGYVYPREDESDIDAMIDGKKRYLTFEYVEEE